MSSFSNVNGTFSGAAGGSVVPAGGPSPTTPASIAVTGQNKIETGRYRIQAQDDGINIYDKQTETWTKVGDSQLRTSDGDSAQFNKNLTLQLQDGTKVKVAMGPDGKIHALGVLKDEQAVVATRDFHGDQPKITVGPVRDNAKVVNAEFEDGTQLTAGRQVDDLTVARGGREIIGNFGKIDGSAAKLDNAQIETMLEVLTQAEGKLKTQVSTFDAPAGGSGTTPNPSTPKAAETKVPQGAAGQLELQNQMKLMNQIQQSYAEYQRLKKVVEADGGPNAVPKPIAAKIAELQKPKSLEDQLKLVNQIRVSLQEYLHVKKSIEAAEKGFNRNMVRNFQ